MGTLWTSSSHMRTLKLRESRCCVLGYVKNKEQVQVPCFRFLWNEGSDDSSVGFTRVLQDSKKTTVCERFFENCKRVYKDGTFILHTLRMRYWSQKRTVMGKRNDTWSQNIWVQIPDLPFTCWVTLGRWLSNLRLLPRHLHHGLFWGHPRSCTGMGAWFLVHRRLLINIC